MERRNAADDIGSIIVPPKLSTKLVHLKLSEEQQGKCKLEAYATRARNRKLEAYATKARAARLSKTQIVRWIRFLNREIDREGGSVCLAKIRLDGA